MCTRLTPFLIAAILLAPSAAGAKDQEGDRQRAAAAFDQGVALYKRAEYAAAARAFLEADGLSPSATAILNAIGAAKRAGDHLLAARTAEKAIARGDAVVEARAALAEAAAKLSLLSLRCEPLPCALSIDGEAVSGDAAYVLPGTHRIEARGAVGTTAEERISAAAGATYRIVMSPQAPAKIEVVPLPRRGPPPAVFFTGLGVTAVLAAVTVWSGADAISAKNALPDPALEAQEDDVRARARRTDYLLLGTGVAAVATGVIGGLTSFRGSATVAPLPGGAMLAAGGRF